MSDRDLDTLFTLEELARLCAVEREWVIRHVEDGLLVTAGTVERQFTPAALVRARRMRQLERDFDAVPELAALMADLLEELDAMRAEMRRRGFS